MKYIIYYGHCDCKMHDMNSVFIVCLGYNLRFILNGNCIKTNHTHIHIYIKTPTITTTAKLYVYFFYSFFYVRISKTEVNKMKIVFCRNENVTLR